MHATREEFPILFGTDAAGIRGADWGGVRTAIVAIPAGVDTSPLLKGLPGDRCPCPHWGYVLMEAATCACDWMRWNSWKGIGGRRSALP